MPQTITWANLFIDIKDEINETSPSETALIRIGNRILNDLVLSLDLPESIRTSEIYYCGSDFEKYAEPTGMKSMALIDIRPRDTAIFSPIKFISPTRYHGYYGGSAITIKRDTGKEHIELMFGDFNGNDTFFTACQSLTADGAWSAGTGATNITLDQYNFKKGNSAINFDVATGGGTTAQIDFAKTTVMNLSGYTVNQRVRFFMKLPTAPTSVTIRWGSDSSNYYSHAVTAQASGESFSTSDWNELEAKKESATVTGTPDDSNIDYFSIILTFAEATTDTDFIIDHIKAIKPDVLILEYYSTYLAKTAAGVYSDAVAVSAGTTDLVDMQSETRQVYLDGLAWRYLRMRGDKQAKGDALMYKQDYNDGKQTLRTKYPSRRRFFARERTLPRLSII